MAVTTPAVTIPLAAAMAKATMQARVKAVVVGLWTTLQIKATATVPACVTAELAATPPGPRLLGVRSRHVTATGVSRLHRRRRRVKRAVAKRGLVLAATGLLLRAWCVGA